MQTNVRELKARLGSYLRRVAAGESVTVTLRSRPIARIVPMQGDTGIKDLASVPGVRWGGGKPQGIPQGEVMGAGVSLSDRVIEDRR